MIHITSTSRCEIAKRSARHEGDTDLGDHETTSSQGVLPVEAETLLTSPITSPFHPGNASLVLSRPDIGRPPAQNVESRKIAKLTAHTTCSLIQTRTIVTGIIDQPCPILMSDSAISPAWAAMSCHLEPQLSTRDLGLGTRDLGKGFSRLQEAEIFGKLPGNLTGD